MIRLSIVTKDFKEPLPVAELNAALKAVRNYPGGDAIVHAVNDTGTDTEVYIVCSTKLTQRQVEKLWKTGDFYLGDKALWKGFTFEDLLDKVHAHAKKADGEGI